MIDNSLQKDKTKTKKELLAEAGYKKSTTVQPSRILDSAIVQAELQKRTAETIQKFEKIRDLSIQAIPRKIAKAPFNHLVNGVDTMQKNIQLLSGKATENTAIHIEISEHVAGKNVA